GDGRDPGFRSESLRAASGTLPASRRQIPQIGRNNCEFRRQPQPPRISLLDRPFSSLTLSVQAWREGKCDGVVTYCLDKQPRSRTFDLARDQFGQYRPTN
ncbi:MAG: hypothetical protein NT154_12445, partial [Verrucomicrobia bacterium]|nr:hypothetical protein [Verrucomicrobiota bacterium]